MLLYTWPTEDVDYNNNEKRKMRSLVSVRFCQRMSAAEEVRMKKEVLMGVNVVCSTLNHSGSQHIVEMMHHKDATKCHFGCVIVDEVTDRSRCYPCHAESTNSNLLPWDGCCVLAPCPEYMSRPHVHPLAPCPCLVHMSMCCKVSMYWPHVLSPCPYTGPMSMYWPDVHVHSPCPCTGLMSMYFPHVHV